MLNAADHWGNSSIQTAICIYCMEWRSFHQITCQISFGRLSRCRRRGPFTNVQCQSTNPLYFPRGRQRGTEGVNVWNDDIYSWGSSRVISDKRPITIAEYLSLPEGISAGMGLKCHHCHDNQLSACSQESKSLPTNLRCSADRRAWLFFSYLATMAFALCVHFIIPLMTWSRRPPRRVPAVPSGRVFPSQWPVVSLAASRQIPGILTALFKWKNQFEGIRSDHSRRRPFSGDRASLCYWNLDLWPSLV